MQGYLSRRIMAIMAFACVVTAAPAGEIVSTMRNVSAVAEAHGFRLNMVHDMQLPPLASDLSPAQAFEVLRPAGKPVTIGRLFTSCSCIQLESPKRTYGPNERVILSLRNIKATPPAGQVYAVFVQITSPVRTTLRFDTFVQSGMANGMPYQNPLSQNNQNNNQQNQNQQQAQGMTTPDQMEQNQSAERPSYRGSAHANALAALSRQIDEGLSRPVEAVAVDTEEPDLAVASPMVPPARREAEESVAEASEVAAVRVPATAVQTPAAAARTEAAAAVAEAREAPAPLPPPAELVRAAAVEREDEILEAEETVAPLQPPPGVAVVPGPAVQANPAPLPSLADTFAANAGGDFSLDFDEDDVDIDDFNPLLNPPPAAAVTAPVPVPAPMADEGLVAPLRPVTATATATAATAPVQQPITEPITMEDFDRVLDGDSVGGGAIGVVSGISDQEILEKERERLEKQDLGTADLMLGFDEAAAVRAPSAAASAALPPVTVTATELAPPIAPPVAPAVVPLTPPVAGTVAPQSASGGFFLDEIAPSATSTIDTWMSGAAPEGAGSPAEELRAAADSLPPPPGLTAPNEVPPLTAAEISAPGATALPPLALQAVTAPVQPAAGVAYEAGVPEPRPARDPSAPKPVQAVSLITVGVRDLPASIRFYEALGWRRAGRGKYDQTAFFQLQGQILALYPLRDLLAEQNMPNATPTPGGITLALHVQDRADVWSVYQRFLDAGGASLRQPAEMASGAVTSYVADPDGNAWEISWVPQFRIDEEGGLWLP